MKRILFVGILTAFLILWQPGSTHLAREKGQAPISWKTVSDFKVFRLWEQPGVGPKEPQIAILQLSSERQKELACDPLAFYKKYDIFKPYSDLSKGQFVVQLGEGGSKYASKDPYIVIVVHDMHTYSATGSFAVDQIN
jgi:hypothetical protein